MDITRSQLAVVATAVLTVMALMTGGAVAAINYDNDTTTAGTTSTSDWLQDQTVTDLDNSSNISTVEVQSTNATDGTNIDLQLIVNETDHAQNGDVVYETNESWTELNATSGNYELNVTHSDAFDGLERDASDNVTLDARTIVNESKASEERVTIQIHAQNGGNPNLVADDRATYEDPAGAFSLSSLNPFSDSESADAAKLDRAITVNGNTTQVTVASNSQNFTDAVDEAGAETEDGEFMAESYVVANGHLIPVFENSVDDAPEWLDTDSETYAVADTTAGSITVYNANETFDSSTSEIDVVAAANAEPAFRDQRSMLSDYGAGIGDQFTLASIGETFEESGV